MDSILKKVVQSSIRRMGYDIVRRRMGYEIVRRSGIASGHPPIDRYLAQSYGRVAGMSSRFAAAICGYLIRRHSA